MNDEVIFQSQFSTFSEFFFASLFFTENESPAYIANTSQIPIRAQSGPKGALNRATIIPRGRSPFPEEG